MLYCSQFIARKPENTQTRVKTSVFIIRMILFLKTHGYIYKKKKNKKINVYTREMLEDTKGR
jgi:hypothetical protein